MIEREGYTYLPNMENNRCFGCGPANPGGLQMEFYSDRDAIVSWLTVPEHLSGWNSLVHGGVVSTILDEVMGRAVIFMLKSLPMTKSMKIDYLKPIYVGTELKAVGRVIEKGERDALLEGIIYDESGDICTRTEAVFKCFSVEAMNKRGALTEEFIELFAKLNSM
jgi:uncharacterized protein (TIGR00369 family)